MMRTYVVPGRYRAALDALVGEAIDRIRLDEHRRNHGANPLIPDFMISAHPEPEAIVAIDSIVVVADAGVSIADAIAQARETAREERRRRKRPA